MREAEKALKRAGRTDSVTLLAVSKTFPAESITEAYEQGQRLFGENKMQEALEKHEKLKSLKELELHFIGHLQTNKVKYLKGNFSLIHSVDRIPLLNEMEKHFTREDRVQDVLIQVNVANDPAKSGVDAAELPALLETASKCRHIRVKGFTMMPPLVNEAEENRIHFARTRELMEEMKGKFASENIDLQILSMGMSDDFTVAVEEGSTLIRIGTALFGGRS
ncbi:YggS family pyridoxal phosphate-dependent enzyme [Geovibrio thiophilus]|uniref:Pyridoxal phosphate homeostasis protein n=2 Tax=Geovibrio thiophilus TaxID=139438 RepID=A0A3R5X4T7_9BACT|nr:YggS family pyridoxal phosphate-dependent enzyme [Geovibrio thiophilus]